MKTYNVELTFKDNSDYSFWIETLKKQRDVFNTCSPLIFNLPQRNSLKLNHDAVYQTARNLYPEFPSQFIIKTEQELTSNYKTILSNKHKVVKPVEKKNLSLRLDKRCYSKFTPQSIFLISSTKNKRVEATLNLYPQVEPLFKLYRTTDPLIFARDNRLFLSVTFDIPLLKEKDSSVVGIDLGMRRLVVTSEGKAISGKEFLKEKRKIRYLKRCLQSKGTKSSKKHLKKERNHEANFSKNYINLLVNEVLKTEKSILVLEDLTKIKEKTKLNKNGYKRTSHNNRMSQIPFFMFKNILTYKAQHIGKRVETVNPAFTSQNDHRGHKRGLRQGCRYYAVDRVVLDADWNASINIAQRYSKHPESTRLPVDGGLALTGRLMLTNQTQLGLSRNCKLDDL